MRLYRDLAPLMPHVPVPALFRSLDDAAQAPALLLIEDLAEEYVPATLPIDPAWIEPCFLISLGLTNVPLPDAADTVFRVQPALR